MELIANMLYSPSLTLGVQDAVNPLVQDLVLVLAASAAVAVALQRLRLAAVSAYLLAGAVLGPDALGLIDSPDRLQAITDLAIILLMFTIGLQLDLGLMRRELRTTLIVGVGSVVASWLVGWPIALAFNLSIPAALGVAMAFSLSSTAVVLRSLSERRELRQPHGRTAFGVLVTQDMAVLLALVIVPLLASWQAGADTGESADLSSGALLDMALRGLFSIAGAIGLIVLARVLLPRLLGEAAQSGARELTLIVATAAAIGAGLATRWLGFSPELGAFLAGLVLASTPFRHQISGQIGPLRDVFIAVFFTVLGMRIDPAGLVEQWWVVLIGVLLMMALKAIIIGGATRIGGATWSIAALVGLSLAQAGEFSLVLLSEARETDLISEVVAANCVAITVISLILTPGLIALSHRAAALLAPRPGDAGPLNDGDAAKMTDRVIIAGFGPVGRAVAERLEQASVPYTVIEMNPRTVRIESSLGRSIVYGDAANPDILEAAGAHEAAAIVLTMPDDTASFAAIRTVRMMNPQIFVVTRTLVVSKAMLARGLGADEAVSDELAAADAMQRAVRRRLIEERLKRGDPTDHKA